MLPSIAKAVAVALTLTVSLFALPACSSGSASHGTGSADATSAASSADSSSFCDSYCTKNATCDSRVDAQTCTTRCEDEVSASLEKRRADVVTGAATCFESSDCHQVLGGKRLAECIAESAVSVAPSPAVKTFCDGLAKAFARCDSTFDRADCMNATKVFSDPTLAQGESCLEKSCSQMATCVSATFGFSSK